MSVGTRRRSVPRRIRQVLGPWIDRLARRLGQPEFHVRDEGYAGTASVPVTELESWLRAAGFAWDPVSLYHRTQAGTDTDGSWVYRPSPLADRQLHVVLFAQSPDRVDVYAHEEYSWLRHPVKHARQEDIRREAGTAEVRRWLADQPFEHESVVWRRARHVLERVEATVTAGAGDRLVRVQAGYRMVQAVSRRRSRPGRRRRAASGGARRSRGPRRRP